MMVIVSMEKCMVGCDDDSGYVYVDNYESSCNYTAGVIDNDCMKVIMKW